MSATPRLTVASYNVHGFVGTDGRFSPERIAEILEDLDADVVALQEVEHRDLAGVPVSDWLGEALGMHAVRGDTFRRGAHDYGNLVLARRPPRSADRHDLSVPGREPRGAIEIRGETDGNGWRVIATHLGLRARERRIQMRQLATLTAGDSETPVIVAGDFNEWRPMYRPERRLGAGFAAGPKRASFPSGRPAIRLDRICVRPAHLLHSARVIANRASRVASDHLPIVAEILLRSPEQARRLASRS